jgi:hypothetical protein
VKEGGREGGRKERRKEGRKEDRKRQQVEEDYTARSFTKRTLRSSSENLKRRDHFENIDVRRLEGNIFKWIFNDALSIHSI